jgi:hypothetical protein
MCAEEAKEALNDDDFEFAFELDTQAIDDGQATTDLYVDRSQALIKLAESFPSDLAFISLPLNIIWFDPTFLRSNLLKWSVTHLF